MAISFFPLQNPLQTNENISYCGGIEEWSIIFHGVALAYKWFHNRLRNFSSGHTSKMAASMVAIICTQSDSHVTTVTWEIKDLGLSQ